MTMYLGVIILLPIVFAIFCIIGAASMGEEHNPLRIALFLLSIVCIFTSMHLGSIIINDINPSFGEMQNLLGITTNWMGWVFAVIVMYFLLYAFYMMIHRIAKQKEQKLNY